MPPSVPRPVLLLLALLGACDPGAPEAGSDDAGAGSLAPRPRYLREFVFLGTHGGEPLAVPFSFASTVHGREIEREARAWLGRGERWEGFVEDRWSTPASTGVWRVLPRGDLRIAARGPAEVGALWFRQGDRSLRLDLGAALSAWSEADATRFRLQRATLALGDETLPGAVLEVLQIARPAAAGAEPPRSDWIFLAAGDSLRLVIGRLEGGTAGTGRSLAWTGGAAGERAWDAAAVEWLETRPVVEARRDIPLGWRFRLPGAALVGEVRALGYEVVLGPERVGRRSLEVRYTVEGWVESAGGRVTVQGVVRHAQD